MLSVDKSTINNQGEKYEYCFRIVKIWQGSDKREILFQSRWTILDQPCWRDDVFKIQSIVDRSDTLHCLEILEKKTWDM